MNIDSELSSGDTRLLCSTPGFAIGVLLTAVVLTVSTAAEAENMAPFGPDGVTPSGQVYELPALTTAAEAPRISCFSEDAGPDESFVLFGTGLTDQVGAWGVSPVRQGGSDVKLRVQLLTQDTLIATVPENAYDGPIVVWARNDAGASQPVVINRPNPWWCSPGLASPGQTLRIFGRNLARRPHHARAFAYLCQPNGVGTWLPVTESSNYQIRAQLPAQLAAGKYQLWVHAGSGGQFGWGGPLEIDIVASPIRSDRVIDFSGKDLQRVVDQIGQEGGGAVRLPRGVIELRSSLEIPAGVEVIGAGRDSTILQCFADPSAQFPHLSDYGWGKGPTGIHTVGDRIVYRVPFAQGGRYQIWLRYATDMAKYGMAGVSQNMILSLDGADGVPLDNLPNTGGWDTFRWSKVAALEIPPGEHELVWKNVRGGGIHLDAWAFTLNPDWTPDEKLLPNDDKEVRIWQAERFVDFDAKDGRVIGDDTAAVILAGDGASIRDLTLCGSPQTNIGIAVRSSAFPAWVRGCRIEGVKVCDVERKGLPNCGVRLFFADQASVRGNEIWGRAPLYLSGVTRCEFSENRLVAVTLFGGNAEAYIEGRNETVSQCIIEDNVFACPPGAEGGGPTGRRLIWLSTGRGSVDHNWIAGNRPDQARFGGVAGTDQNVGEMILFEACQRIAFHGRVESSNAASVTLPATVPATPDELLGSVPREKLAHDPSGNETPFWPPEHRDQTGEAPSGEYFVTIVSGPGRGQTRQVLRREGRTYLLTRPWRVQPESESVILIHTAFYRNHVVDNETSDGMTGVQLWISCIENVVSANRVLRCRKPGVYLFGNCSTLASSMPMTWNRGIGPLNFNHIEGTLSDETSCGIYLAAGNQGELPVEFPRCLGNVLRHNSMIRNRTDGLLINGRQPSGGAHSSPSVLGTIAELNVVRDAQNAYHLTPGVDATLLRRNHAYFWNPVQAEPYTPVAFLIDDPESVTIVEQNSVEGTQGTGDRAVITEQRGPRDTNP